MRIAIGWRVLALSLLLGLPLASGVSMAAQSFDLDVIMPLTGGGSFLGKAEQQSLQLLEASVNKTGGIQGRPLRFVFYDDQTNPQIAVQLASQVIAARPPVILGSSIVAMCNAMAPLMQNGPVQYCFSPGIHPPAGSYVFTSSVSTFDLANALIRYFRLRGWTRIALMTSTDASGQDAEKRLKSIIALPENKDVHVVVNVHFNTTDVSVSAQIEKIKAANPQAFIAWSTGAPIATIFRGIVQAGLDVPVGTTDGNMTYAQMTQYASFLPKQLYFPAGQWVESDPSVLDPAVAKKTKVFRDVYREAGAQPDVAASLAWEPAVLVVEALRKLGPKASAEQVRDFLAHLRGYAGIDGTYDFEKVPQRGLDVSDAVVARWNGLKKTWDVVSKVTGVPLEQ